MFKQTALLVFSFSFALSGCLTTNYANKTPVEIAEKISVHEDTFDNVLRLRAPMLYSGFSVSYQLRTTIDKETGAAVHIVFVEDDYFKSNSGSFEDRHYSAHGSETAFRNFFTARDSNGTRFRVTSGTKSFEGCKERVCFYEEKFAIVIPDKYLVSLSGKPMALRVSSKSGVYIDLSFPASYVQAVLIKTENERNLLSR